MKYSFPLFFALLFSVQIQTADAQNLTIPDPNFVAWLQNNGYAVCLNGNQLNASCPEVVNATMIDCFNSGISDLTGIDAFINLQSLYCSNNQLVALPQLPSTLTFLECESNGLTALPSLPLVLEYLNCFNNQLTGLPTLPISLKTLYCDNNQLTGLPTLPAGLLILSCSNNQLNSLPPLPTTLQSLFCSGNLNINLPPTLPPSLTQLGCINNQLASLPSLPIGLEVLFCQNNQLTSLPPLPNCKFLFCHDNQLESLPALPDTMTGLRCHNNPGLQCLPPFSAYTGFSYYFDISNTGISCLPNYIQHAGFIPAIDTMPICGPGNPNGCAFIVACTVPGNLSASSVAVQNANLTWSTVAVATKYRVRIKNMATGQTYLSIVNAPDTIKTFTGLAPNTLFKAHVRSQCTVNGSILSPWSSPIYFTTLPGTATNCVAPQNVSSSSSSSTSAFISWTVVNGANGYQLRHRPVGTITWTPVVINNGMAGGVLLNGLQPNTDYQYQVRTKCSVNPLTWSNYSPLQYFSTPLRLGEDELKPLVQLFPNPSNGTVSFNPNGLVGTVSIFDAVGRIIFHQAVSGETELTNLPNGFLTYRFVETDGKMVNGKFVVAR